MWRRATHSLRTEWKRHLLTLATALAVMVAIQLWQTRHVPGGPLPAAALDAPLTVLAADGGSRQSNLREEIATLQRQHPGRNLALYVWADWCPICKTLQSTVDGLSHDHPVITVAMQSGPSGRVATYLRSRGLAWHTVVDPRSQIPQALGFSAVPAFAVITPQAELRWPTVGLTSGWGMRLRLWWAS